MPARLDWPGSAPVLQRIADANGMQATLIGMRRSEALARIDNGISSLVTGPDSARQEVFDATIKAARDNLALQFFAADFIAQYIAAELGLKIDDIASRGLTIPDDAIPEPPPAWGVPRAPVAGAVIPGHMNAPMMTGAPPPGSPWTDNRTAAPGPAWESQIPGGDVANPQDPWRAAFAQPAPGGPPVPYTLPGAMTPAHPLPGGAGPFPAPQPGVPSPWEAGPLASGQPRPAYAPGPPAHAVHAGEILPGYRPAGPMPVMAPGQPMPSPMPEQVNPMGTPPGWQPQAGMMTTVDPMTNEVVQGRPISGAVVQPLDMDDAQFQRQFGRPAAETTPHGPSLFSETPADDTGGRVEGAGGDLGQPGDEPPGTGRGKGKGGRK